MTRRARVATGALALLGSVLAGWMAGVRPDLFLPVVGVLVAAAVLFAAPPRLLVWIAGAGVLVTQARWGLPVTSIGSTDVYAGDLLELLAVAAAVSRPGAGRLWRAGLVLAGLLTGWALLRSDSAGDVTFLRLVLPLFVMLAVARRLPPGYDLRRDLRWFPIAVLISVPLTGGGALVRWTSIAGGSNETGLVGALAVALGMTYAGRWRYLLWAAGGALLFGTAGITATIAAVAAMAYYAVAPKVAGRRVGRSSPLLVLWAALAAAVVVPLLRVDVAGTVDAHLFQVSKFGRVIGDGDPLLGVGWGHVDLAAFLNSNVEGLHNVYLDVIAYLGLVGLLLFAALLVAIWGRGAVPTRTLLVTWLVWVNTSGAFPGAAWGLLGFILASAALSTCSDQEAEQGDAERLRGAGRGRVDARLDHTAGGR